MDSLHQRRPRRRLPAVFSSSLKGRSRQKRGPNLLINKDHDEIQNFSNQLPSIQNSRDIKERYNFSRYKGESISFDLSPFKLDFDDQVQQQPYRSNTIAEQKDYFNQGQSEWPQQRSSLNSTLKEEFYMNDLVKQQNMTINIGQVTFGAGKWPNSTKNNRSKFPRDVFYVRK